MPSAHYGSWPWGSGSATPGPGPARASAGFEHVEGSCDSRSATGLRQARHRQAAAPKIAQHGSPRRGRLAVPGRTARISLRPSLRAPMTTSKAALSFSSPAFT